MKEEKNSKPINVNLFTIIAIAVVVLLFIVSFAQIFSINAKNSQIKKQQAELDRLNQELEYHKSNEQEKNENDEFYDIVGEQ